MWNHVAKLAPEQKEVKLLEAGVGTGKNIAYYPPDVEAYAIDFSKKMLEEARHRAEKLEADVQLTEMDIQNLDFADNYFDLIVTSCVFCSVPDPVEGLQELKRVIKPEGKIIMLEHMRSNKEPLGYLMDGLNWVSLLTWGANINRQTMKNIKQAGLKVVKEENLMLDIVKEIVLVY